MKLSQQAWQRSLAIIEKIEQHPFNQQLGLGTLANEKFQYYLAQDTLYLESYLQTFTYIVAKIDKPFQEKFHQYIESMIHFEKKNVHDVFQVKPIEDAQQGMTMATLAYTNCLLNIAQAESAAVAVAAVLPCFWVYAHIAEYLKPLSPKNNPCQVWIDIYSSAAFLAANEEAIAIFDQLALTANSIEQSKMLDAFYHSTCFEWHFWNDAYHCYSIDSCIVS